MKYFIFFLLSINLFALEIATVTKLSGEVVAKVKGESIRLQNTMSLDEEMIVMTKSDSSITIIFKDNSELVLGENSILNLKKFVFKPVEKQYDFQLFLEEGSLAFESGKIGELSPEDFELKTPDATVAIRGTKFFVKVQ